MAVLGLIVLLWGSGLPWVRARDLAPWRRAALAPFAGMLSLFLLGTLLHLLQIPAGWWFLASVGAAASLWLCRGELNTWAHDRQTRGLLLHLLVWTGWLLACLALIRHYSGGDWTNDWIGHYHRTQHILHQAPGDERFFATDPFPSRPPLLNTILAFVLAATGDTYAHFQVGMLCLGALALLPARLLLAELTSEHSQRAEAWLLVLFMASPTLTQNATFPWTKLGTAAWILLAGVETWRGLRHGRSRDLQWAGAFAGGAVASHYSAAIYLVVAVGTVAWLARRATHRRAILRALPIAAALFLLVMGTWLTWSITRFGWVTTFASNSTVSYAQEGDAVTAFWINLQRTMLPAGLLPAADSPWNPPGNPWAAARDHAFHFYQGTLPGLLGSGGLLLLLLGHRLWWPFLRRHGIAAVPAAALVLLGIAAHTQAGPWGVAHICLLTVALVFLPAAAVMLTHLSLRARSLVAAALLLDFTMGVGLQLILEQIHVPAELLVFADGAPLRAAYGQTLWLNAAMQAQAGTELLGTYLPEAVATPLTVLLGATFVGVLVRTLKTT